MKSKLLVVFGLLAVLALAFWGYAWRQSQLRTAEVQAAIPDTPELGELHPELAARVGAAEARARDGSVGALAELSRLYHANGFTREAWQCYVGLMRAEPSNAAWPYRLASILAGYGQLEEATPLYRRSLSLDPRYMPAYIRIGDALLKQNLISEAKAAYQRALDRDSNNAYALVGMGRVAIANGDWNEARVQLEKAIASSSFQIGADLLGDVYEKLGLSAKEQIVLKNAVWGSYADIPDPRMLELMDDSYDAYQVSISGGWAAHQGDTRTGLRYLRRAVELDPGNFMLHHQIAGLYLQVGDRDNAQKSFQRAAELQPDFADAWIELIRMAEDQRNHALARRLLDQAYSHNPNSPSLNIRKGDAMLSQGRHQQAMNYFRRSIELRPHEAGGYLQLARAYLAMDRVPEAMGQMREALKVEPSNPIALSTLLMDAIMSGDKPRADEWFRRLSVQPKLTEQEIGALAQRYQQQFQTRPPR